MAALIGANDAMLIICNLCELHGADDSNRCSATLLAELISVHDGLSDISLFMYFFILFYFYLFIYLFIYLPYLLF